MSTILCSCLFLLLSVWGISCQAGDCSVDHWCKMESGTTNILWDIWGSSSTDVWASGSSKTIIHYDGNNWSAMASVTSSIYHEVWGTGANNVFAAGGAKIDHYDGNNWSVAYLYNDDGGATSIWGSSSTDVWAVGVYCSIRHYNGLSWSVEDIDSWCIDEEGAQINMHLKDVWGSSAYDVWAVGGSWEGGTKGLIFHYNGSKWARVHEVPYDLESIWASGENDVFVVGGEDVPGESYGVILHYDGTSWSEMSIEGAKFFGGIWGSGPNDVYAVEVAMGGSDVIWHYDGATWSPMEAGIREEWTSVWGNNPNDVFVVGYNGRIIRRHIQGPFKLSVNVSGNGSVTSVPAGIDCPPDCNESYAENTPVKLTAKAEEGAIFGSWSGSCYRSLTTCNVLMDRDRQVGLGFGKKGGDPWSYLLLLKKQK